AVRQLHAARLTAPARVHLRLHDDLPAEPRGDRSHLVRGGRDFRVRHGNAELLEDVPRLVLVEVHVVPFVMVVPASPCNAASPCDSSAMIARSPPCRTNAAAASALGRIEPVPSSFPASRCS